MDALHGGIFRAGVLQPHWLLLASEQVPPEGDKVVTPGGDAVGCPRAESPCSPHSWVPWTHHPVLANDHGHDDLVLEVQRDEQRRPNCEREREERGLERPVPPGGAGRWGGTGRAEARMWCQLCSSRAEETGTLAP